MKNFFALNLLKKKIIEMNKTKPEVILNWLANYSDLVKSKILVCGGSVGWILELISKIKFKVHF